MVTRAAKDLLRNTMRTVDHHNRLLEEQEMWRQWELEQGLTMMVSDDTIRQRQKDRSSRAVSKAEEDRIRRRKQKIEKYRKLCDSTKGCAEKRNYWMKKLMKVEEQDPERWGHGGYKSLYPDEFEDSSPKRKDTKQRKEKLKERSRQKSKSRKRKRKERQRRKSRSSSESSGDDSSVSSSLLDSRHRGNDSDSDSSSDSERCRNRSKQHKRSSRRHCHCQKRVRDGDRHQKHRRSRHSSNSQTHSISHSSRTCSSSSDSASSSSDEVCRTPMAYRNGGNATDDND